MHGQQSTTVSRYKNTYQLTTVISQKHQPISGSRISSGMQKQKQKAQPACAVLQSDAQTGPSDISARHQPDPAAHADVICTQYSTLCTQIMAQIKS